MPENKRKEALQKLADFWQIHVRDYDLLDLALTHPSYVFDHDRESVQHNQRLEFLGDAVLDLIVGEYLYQIFPEKPEGELTRMRAALVCEHAFANAAKRAKLGEYLLLGKGERNNGGDRRPSNLADAWEAVIGSFYLSMPLEEIKPFAIRLLQPEIEMIQKGLYGDYKTQLQEIIQKTPNQKIDYRILAQSGPDHNKNFTAGVYLNRELKGQGHGKTKKEAEQNAALAFLRDMGVYDE